MEISTTIVRMTILKDHQMACFLRTSWKSSARKTSSSSWSNSQIAAKKWSKSWNSATKKSRSPIWPISQNQTNISEVVWPDFLLLPQLGSLKWRLPPEVIPPWKKKPKRIYIPNPYRPWAPPNMKARPSDALSIKSGWSRLAKGAKWVAFFERSRSYQFP